MTLSEISKTRIINQKIEYSDFKSPKEIVKWMGAIQAQDFAMSKWAIGLRLKESTENTIEAAFNKGEVIRTHIMRPTWHLVSSDDIYWLLDLTASKIKSTMKSRNKELDLTPEVFKKSLQIIEKVLLQNGPRTREEIASEFQKANIRTDENRLSHILMEAELDQLICSGSLKNNKITYALLQERIPIKKQYTKEESLAKLASRYFTSHGPATLKDFIWWSGLSLTEAKLGLELVKSDFNHETIALKEYWFSNVLIKPELKNAVYLLPAFDEFLIAYCDRSATIDQVINKKAISNNGIFRPILVVNGQVSGIWKRTVKKDKILIELEPFINLKTYTKNEIEKIADQYFCFYGKKTEILYK